MGHAHIANTINKANKELHAIKMIKYVTDSATTNVKLLKQPIFQFQDLALAISKT